MTQYRKKPIVIDAMQFDGTSSGADAVIQFVGDDSGVSYTERNGMRHYNVRIETLEGAMDASPGDWIIKGIKGEFYPCKPDIFAATYERVTDTAPARALEVKARALYNRSIDPQLHNLHILAWEELTEQERDDWRYKVSNALS